MPKPAVVTVEAMKRYDPADALRGLRQLLQRLESRQMSVNQGGTDVTTREIAVLRREIEQLERTLSRLSR
jgi:hypothetical protein